MPKTLPDRDPGMTAEEATIRAFVVRQKRDRYLLLLSDPKRRLEGLDRLNHCADLDGRFVTWLRGGDDVVAILAREGSPSQVYVISGHRPIDGRVLPLADAVEQAAMGGFGTLVSCVPGKLAYYYDEVGARRAVLRRR